MAAVGLNTKPQSLRIHLIGWILIDSGVPMVALEIAEMGNQCTACHLAVPLFFAEDGDYIVSRWRAVQAFAFRTIFSL